MIRIETVEEIPECDWTDFSAKEMLITKGEARGQMLARSFPLQVIMNDETPIGVVGLYRESLLSFPFLWILLTKSFKHSAVSDYMHMARLLKQHGPMWTLVDVNNSKASRLVRAFGFKPEDGTVLVADTIYKIWRKK